MKNQTILLAISLVAIGVFVMPSTVSLFTGQHTFYNGSSVNCKKCHADIYEEFEKIVNNGGSTAHANANWPIQEGTAGQKFFLCTECHRVDLNISLYYSTNNPGGRANAHAATTVPCLACHGDKTDFGYGDAYNPMHKLARKYGMMYDYADNRNKDTCGQCHREPTNPSADNMFIYHIDDEMSGSDEAHRPYYYQSDYPDNQTDIKLKDANTACIGCHTHTTINITWKRHIGYDMIINHSSGEYNITYVKNNTMTTTYSGGE